MSSACCACELHKGRVIPVFSKGNENVDILICGMCPGPDENDPKNTDEYPFVGKAGKFLDEIIEESELTLADVYITNIVKCFVKPGIKLQTDWVESCFPYFISEVTVVNPKVIVTLGKDSFCGLFGETEDPLGSIRKKSYDFFGSVVVPTYHPSYLLRGGRKEHKDYEKVIEDLNRARLVCKGSD